MNKLLKYKVKDFNLKHIFECGQCFRWISDGSGKYTGVVGQQVATVHMESNDTLVINVHLKNPANTACSTQNELLVSDEYLYDFWYNYFDLGRNYSEIKEAVAKDDVMKKAIKFGDGIRLLRQDFNELIFSFIISANNRIPRIMKSVEILSSLYGEKICDIETHAGIKEYFTFPSIEKLTSLSLEQINQCKAGFRCSYIKNTAARLVNSDKSTDPTKNYLLSLPGVGPKVSDCILLFSGTDYSSFPIDVWVRRVMENLYFKRPATFKEIADFAQDYWGCLAGFAQQYLFYYARENG